MVQRGPIDRTLCVIALLAAAACILILARPLLHRGLPTGHDTAAHVTYTHVFDRALRQGQLPVRWVRIADGDTQPLFNFYQPGFYYLVELTHVPVRSLPLALKLTVLASWWLGAVALFALGRQQGRLEGAAAAVLFASSPYVLLDVFVRAAYPELMALSCAAVLLVLVDRYARTGGHGITIAIAVLSGIMLVCHLPASLIGGGAVAAYACVAVRRGGGGWRRLGGLALASAAGLALAAFYVVPALVELPHVRMSALTSGYFDYRRHFVSPVQWITYTWGHGGSVEGPGDEMSFQIGMVQWIVLAGSVFVAIAARRPEQAWARRATIFWLVVAAVALFAMTPAARPAWALVAPLRYVQFPWRFLMVPTIAASALAALVVHALPGVRLRALAVIGLACAQLWLCLPYTVPAGYIGTDALSAGLFAQPGSGAGSLRGSGLLSGHLAAARARCDGTLGSRLGHRNRAAGPRRRCRSCARRQRAGRCAPHAARPCVSWMARAPRRHAAPGGRRSRDRVPDRGHPGRQPSFGGPLRGDCRPADWKRHHRGGRRGARSLDCPGGD